MPRTHKTLPRLFVSPGLAPVLAAKTSLVLDKASTNHLINVRRLRLRDELVVFDGVDGAWLARIEDASRKGAVIVPVEQIAAQPPRSDLWYFFAPLKTGRLDYMIQKATEMGVGHLQPVRTAHTRFNAPKPARMRTHVIEAAQQCEVLNLPQVHDPVALGRLISDWQAGHGDRVLIFADEAAPSGSPVAALETVADRPLALLIGPEGGFDDGERQLLRRCNFALPVSLGPRILRADTAAVAALTVIQSIIGDWR